MTCTMWHVCPQMCSSGPGAMCSTCGGCGSILSSSDPSTHVLRDVLSRTRRRRFRRTPSAPDDKCDLSNVAQQLSPTRVRDRRSLRSSKGKDGVRTRYRDQGRMDGSHAGKHWRRKDCTSFSSWALVVCWSPSYSFSSTEAPEDCKSWYTSWLIFGEIMLSALP